MSESPRYISNSGLTGSGLYATMNGRFNWDALRQRVDDLMRNATPVGGAAVGAGRALARGYTPPKPHNKTPKTPRTGARQTQNPQAKAPKPAKLNRTSGTTNKPKMARPSVDNNDNLRDLFERRKKALERFSVLEKDRSKIEARGKKIQAEFKNLRNELRNTYGVKGRISLSKPLSQQPNVRQAVESYLRIKGIIQDNMDPEVVDRLIQHELQKGTNGVNLEDKRRQLSKRQSRYLRELKANNRALDDLRQELGDIEKQRARINHDFHRQVYIDKLNDLDLEFKKIQQEIKKKHGVTITDPKQRFADATGDAKLAQRLEQQYRGRLDSLAKAQDHAKLRLNQINQLDAAMKNTDTKLVGDRVLRRHSNGGAAVNPKPAHIPQNNGGGTIHGGPSPAAGASNNPNNLVNGTTGNRIGPVARARDGLAAFRNSKPNVAFGNFLNTPLAKFGGRALGVLGTGLLVLQAGDKSAREFAEHKDLGRAAASFAIRSGVSVALTTGAAALGMFLGSFAGPIGAFALSTLFSVGAAYVAEHVGDYLANRFAASVGSSLNNVAGSVREVYDNTRRGLGFT